MLGSKSRAQLTWVAVSVCTVTRLLEALLPAIVLATAEAGGFGIGVSWPTDGRFVFIQQCSAIPSGSKNYFR